MQEPSVAAVQVAPGSQRDDVLVELAGLRTHFFTEEGLVRAVDGVDLQVRRGRTLCVVGESGCGKSITARSILQLVDPPGRVVDGQILLHRSGGEVLDLAELDPRGREIRDVRGKDISMIFQEPMTSLSLVHTVGDQIVEAIRVHRDVSKAKARRAGRNRRRADGLVGAPTRRTTSTTARCASVMPTPSWSGTCTGRGTRRWSPRSRTSTRCGRTAAMS
ncbi:ATP-binding cassette domain-containing protein [Pseudonocardia nigra]|uniref:ATP-binding cassette domain-containing protein n=1 Tax=Pseudonocardia nigra TaxID=1921578 RepID=UPI001C5FFDA1|nr:ATP-binding cassette domain-containing protein [Pseudonocardia nigra]